MKLLDSFRGPGLIVGLQKTLVKRNQAMCVLIEQKKIVIAACRLMVFFLLVVVGVQVVGSGRRE